MRRTAGMLTASIAAMVLTGCGPSNPAPKPFNPPKAPSVSGSVVDTAPEMPEEAKQNNAAGAKAFVRYYFEVFNEAVKTGDMTRPSQLASPKCVNCRKSVESTTKIYRAGGWIKGGELKPVTFQRMIPDAYQFTVTMHINKQSQATSAAATIETIPAHEVKVAVVVERDSDSWQMVEWGVVQ